MKISINHLKKIIRESLVLNEAATGMGKEGIAEVARLGFRFVIREHEKNRYYILDLYHNEDIIGEFDLDGELLSTCGYWQTHSYLDNPEDSNVAGKIGPFCYDILIELGTLLGSPVSSSGQPSGIKYDEVKKGERAIKLWVYYDARRNDLTKNKIKLCKGDQLRISSINYINNSMKGMGHAKFDKKIRQHFIEKGPAMISALTSSYQKPPIFLKELIRMGLLEINNKEILSLLYKVKPQKSNASISKSEPIKIEINISRQNMGQRWAKNYFGDEAKYWDQKWQMELIEYTDGLFLEPNVHAQNDTMLNGKKVTESTMLKKGDVIGVGKESKGIVKTQFIVISDKFGL